MSRKKRWVAIAADAFDHPIVGTQLPPPTCADGYPWSPFQAWAWMVKEAAFAERTVMILDREIRLQRGQLVLAERHLCRVTHWGRSAGRGFLARLERAGMIARSAPADAVAARKGQIELDFAGPGVEPGGEPPATVVTICNYEKYQRPITRTGPGVGPPIDPSQYQGLPKREDSSVGPVEIPITQESNRETILGTDKERLPFTEEALAACEAMGFTRQELVDRYRQKTQRRTKPIRDPSAYLISMAIDMAAKARGVPEEALRKSLSKSRTERAAGFVESEVPRPSDTILKSVERRCKRKGCTVDQVLAAWQSSRAGLGHPRNVDGSFDGFATAWLAKRGMH